MRFGRGPRRARFRLAGVIEATTSKADPLGRAVGRWLSPPSDGGNSPRSIRHLRLAEPCTQDRLFESSPLTQRYKLKSAVATEPTLQAGSYRMLDKNRVAYKGRQENYWPPQQPENGGPPHFWVPRFAPFSALTWEVFPPTLGALPPPAGTPLRAERGAPRDYYTDGSRRRGRVATSCSAESSGVN